MSSVPHFQQFAKSHVVNRQMFVSKQEERMMTHSCLERQSSSFHHGRKIALAEQTAGQLLQDWLYAGMFSSIPLQKSE